MIYEFLIVILIKQFLSLINLIIEILLLGYFPLWFIKKINLLKNIIQSKIQHQRMIYLLNALDFNPFLSYSAVFIISLVA